MWTPAVASDRGPGLVINRGSPTVGDPRLPRSRPLVQSAWGRTLEEAQVVLLQRICRHPGCRAVFWICRSCFRGQSYCSLHCRIKARRQQLRAANRRYQQSSEGRLDHRDRQRAYRRRLLDRVTDHGRSRLQSSARISAPMLGHLQIATTVDLAASRIRHVFLVCSICGRAGFYIQPFYSGG